MSGKKIRRLALSMRFANEIREFPAELSIEDATRKWLLDNFYWKGGGDFELMVHVEDLDNSGKLYRAKIMFDSAGEITHEDWNSSGQVRKQTEGGEI